MSTDVAGWLVGVAVTCGVLAADDAGEDPVSDAAGIHEAFAFKWKARPRQARAASLNLWPGLPIIPMRDQR
jgi:hypothetical protein